MLLRAGFVSLAVQLQEAADLSSSDVRSRLNDAVNDVHRGTGNYGYYLDHFGDDSSGDVIYQSGGKTKRAPYSVSQVGDSGAKASIDDSSAENVTPRTIYEPDCDEADHMAAMESLKTEKLYTEIPVYERFISKPERDKAGSEDFAGKGKSFPILKPEDVQAAVHAMGRAGAGNLGPSGIKSRIIAIAKRKGWTDKLPKAWQTGSSDAVEGDRATKDDATLVESCVAAEVLRISESAGELNPLVKIISAGRGSTGYYTEALLKRDGPKIFKRGTLMYINHATNAEEAARPEGDWSKLAAVTTGDAYWDAHGKDGPALYAPSKVFSNVAAEVREKAPYTGVSIRAAGLYAEAATGEAKKGVKFDESKMAPDGKPGLIGQLTRADSIDLVTKAGRDGKLLLESAVNLNEGGEVDMTEAEVKKLQESVATLQADNRKFKERAAIADAAGVVATYFGTVNVPTGIKERVTKRVLAGSIPLTEAGDLDKVKLTSFVEAETKDEASYVESLTGSKIVIGMGAGAAPEQVTEAQRKEIDAANQRESDDFAKAMGFTGKGPGAAILREGRGEFDLDYNSGKRDGVTSGAKAVN